DKNQVCLLCEVILKQIPAFNFFCASLESITAIEKLGKWEKVWEDIPTLYLGFVWAGKMEFGEVGSFGPSFLITNFARCYEAVKNGFSECFKSVLVSVRHRPIITMLELIRVIVMKRMNTMRYLMKKWSTDVCPNIQKILEHSKDQQRRGSDAFKVDEPNRTCSCRMWQISDDDNDVPPFVNDDINKFEMGASYSRVVFNDGRVFNVGRFGFNKKKKFGSSSTSHVKLRGGKTKGGRLFLAQRLDRMGMWLGMDGGTSDTIEEAEPFQASMSLLKNPFNITVMDPNSSLGKICLGEDVVVILSDKVEGSGDWNSLEFQDTANSGKKKETKAMVFYQIETEEVSDRFVAPCFVNGMEAYDGEINLGVEENMISNEYAVKLCLEHEVKKGNKVVKKELIVALRGTSSLAGAHLTQEEEAKEAIAIRMSRKFALLEEERPIIETMAYHDKYKKILNEVWKDNVELDGTSVAQWTSKVNKNALADTGSDINIMPYRIYEHLGREDMKKVDRGIMMINHTQAEAMGILINVLCQVGVTTLIAKFLILDILIDRDLPIVVGRGFLRTIDGIVNTLERLFSTFDGFCHQTFRATRSDVMRNAKSDSDDEEDYQIKRNKFGAPVYGPKPAPYLNCNDLDERSLAIQTEHTMMRPDHHDLNALDNMKPWKRYCFHKLTMSSCYGNDVTEMQSLGCDGEIEDMLRIRLCEVGSDEEIFTSMAWIRAFNINEPIYVELCHKFYSTYEFDEVCADDELQTKKIIKFRLGGRAHSLTLLEFAQRLGLYQAVELKEEGFNVYFKGGLRSDEHFNAHDYWLSINREENLGLSRSHTSTIKNLILRIPEWFISKIARKCKVLTEDVVRSLSALIYCRDLDTTILRDLIDFEGRLIPEDPQPGVPRVGIPRPPRASMQNLYDRMGRMEIRQEAIKRMDYRQSYR
ncbi:retrotransposon ORF1, partial [Tanacetum coccineum]